MRILAMAFPIRPCCPTWWSTPSQGPGHVLPLDVRPGARQRQLVAPGDATSPRRRHSLSRKKVTQALASREGWHLVAVSS